MTILKQLETDFNQALRQKNELVILTLRQLKTAIVNAEIAKKRQKLTQEEIIKVFKSEVKKRKEAIQLYKKGSRNELAEKEQKEIEIITKYLPAEMGEEDIRKKVKAVISQMRATGPQDLGKIMGKIMVELKGQADGSIVSKIVREELTSQTKELE